MAVKDPESKKYYGPTVSLEESYRRCRQVMRSRLADQQWLALNLGSDDKRHLSAILSLGGRVADLCSIHIGKPARQDQLADYKDELQDNLMGRESTGELAAVVDTIERFGIPQQFIFDMLTAADFCLKLERFETFDQWLVFGCRLGGSAMVATSKIVGTDHDGFESAAISCGQAIQLTQMLGTIGTEIQLMEYYLPKEFLDQFNVDLGCHNPARPDKSTLQMIRFIVTEIEKVFRDAGKLMDFLSFDGRRFVGMVISVYWHLLMRIKKDPSELLQRRIALSGQERFQFKLKHLMGFDGGAPVLPEAGH